MNELRGGSADPPGPAWSDAYGFGNIDRMTPAMHSQIVKRLGAAVGFDRVGITHAGPLERIEYYRRWLAAGHAGAMGYLSRNIDRRADPAQLLPGAKSIICIAVNYRRGAAAPASAEQQRAADGAPTGRVAMYAQGADYHVELHRMLAEFITRLHAGIPVPFEARPFVDTGPLVERELAARAGVGWIGKNTLLLSAGLGSFFFLGEVVTTLELAPDEPIPDHCGACTRCLEACPTQAFTAPYQMDASRCISYLTIEHRGDIASELAARMGEWLYGCDVCQDVCPHNARAPVGTNSALAAERIPARLSLPVLTALRSGEYKRLVAGAAARRAGRRMWQRNAAIVTDNLRRKEAAAGIGPAPIPTADDIR